MISLSSTDLTNSLVSLFGLIFKIYLQFWGFCSQTLISLWNSTVALWNSASQVLSSELPIPPYQIYCTLLLLKNTVKVN